MATSKRSPRSGVARRATDRVRTRLRDDLLRLCEDAGVTGAELAIASGVSKSHAARILAGDAGGSLETYVRLAVALGADLSAHVYPNTGPPIRDRHQARMLEALLRDLDPRWRRSTEVVVTRPVHGVIDLVLTDARAGQIIAVEIQSELRRLEQLVRWTNEKAAALPSAPRWPSIVTPGQGPTVSSLLVVRRTRATVEVAEAFGRQLEAAFPAHPADALRSLRGDGPWPGSALVWARIDGGEVHFMARR